jgi:hypothetical protein
MDIWIRDPERRRSQQEQRWVQLRTLSYRKLQLSREQLSALTGRVAEKQGHDLAFFDALSRTYGHAKRLPGSNLEGPMP